MKSNNKEKKKEVSFYLSEEDNEMLNLKSDQLRVSKSFFVRNCVLRELGKKVVIPNERNFEFDDYRNSLMKIGVNLNQIARKVNSGVNLKFVEEGELMESINLIKNHIEKVQSKF